MLTEQFISEYKIKRVVIIENETVETGSSLGRLARRLIERGVDVTIVNSAFHKQEEVVAAVLNADTVLFESQFDYQRQVQVSQVAMLFAKMPTKKIFGHAFLERDTLEIGLERMLTDKQLASMKHQQLFAVSHWNDLMDDEGEDTTSDKTPIRIVNLERYARKVKAIELLAQRKIINERRNNNQMSSTTKRKIKILGVVAFGPQFSTLKEGSVVDEVDAVLIDPNPNEGVWVQGKDEPVKLINDNRGQEWEYVDPNSFEVGLQILSAIGQRANPIWLMKIQKWVEQNGVASTKSHDAVMDLLDSFGVPQRFYRSYIENLLRKWNETRKISKSKVALTQMIEQLEQKRLITPKKKVEKEEEEYA